MHDVLPFHTMMAIETVWLVLLHKKIKTHLLPVHNYLYQHSSTLKSGRSLCQTLYIFALTEFNSEPILKPSSYQYMLKTKLDEYSLYTGQNQHQVTKWGSVGSHKSSKRVAVMPRQAFQKKKKKKGCEFKSHSKLILKFQSILFKNSYKRQPEKLQ